MPTVCQNHDFVVVYDVRSGIIARTSCPVCDMEKRIDVLEMEIDSLNDQLSIRTPSTINKQ